MQADVMTHRGHLMAITRHGTIVVRFPFPFCVDALFMQASISRRRARFNGNEIQIRLCIFSRMSESIEGTLTQQYDCRASFEQTADVLIDASQFAEVNALHGVTEVRISSIRFTSIFLHLRVSFALLRSELCLAWLLLSELVRQSFVSHRICERIDRSQARSSWC